MTLIHNCEWTEPYRIAVFGFNHKIGIALRALRALAQSSNFCFGHSFEYYVMVIYFYIYFQIISRSNIKIFNHVSKKNHFFCGTKKLISFFAHHKFFIFNFYTAYWQHVDLLRSGFRNKETFNPSFLLTGSSY